MTIESTFLQPVPGPTRVGQATAVEQARAVAEVAAAVQVAQLFPRDINVSRAAMQRSCAEFRFAEAAFFAYKRGGKTVTGPTIGFARELKRCFGNFQSGLAELRRDDEHGQSELQAWAWDVQHNSRSVTTFVVPHSNYMTGKPLTELRDVYENNANQGARREREMILGLLPTWYVEEAVDLCHARIKAGDGQPLSVRQQNAAGKLGELGIDAPRIERRIGRRLPEWTPDDLARLSVLYRSISRGELDAQEEFPQATVTADDLGPAAAPANARPAAAAPAQRQPAAAPAAPAPASPAADAPITQKQWRDINASFVKAGVTGPGQTEKRLAVLSKLAGHAVTGWEDLRHQEAETILGTLQANGRAACAEILGTGRPAAAEVPPGHVEDPQTGTVVDVQHDEYPDPYATLDPTTQQAWASDGGPVEQP